MIYLEKFTFIAYGELLIDEIYDSSKNLLKKDGGDGNMNVIYHLASMNENCYAIGTVGNDSNADIAISSLYSVGVNTKFIRKISKPTNIVYQYMSDGDAADTSVRFSLIHPETGVKSLVVSAKELSMDIPYDLENKNIILVLHNIEPVNIKFINSIQNKIIALDIGNVSTINHLEKKYIYDFLLNVKICQIHISALKTILRKMDVANSRELYELFQFDLMIITQSEDAVIFFYNDLSQGTQQLEKKPEIVINPKDPTGAGDAFFSVFLKLYSNYLSLDKPIDVDFINTGFYLANLFSFMIVQEIGARGNGDRTVERWLDQIEKQCQKKTVLESVKDIFNKVMNEARSIHECSSKITK